MIKKLVSIAFFILFVSCIREPIERYCNGIVIEKYDTRHKLYVLKFKGEITTVYLFDYDYYRYKIGDTIKCSEEDEVLYKEKEDIEEEEEEEDIWSR